MFKKVVLALVFFGLLFAVVAKEVDFQKLGGMLAEFPKPGLFVLLGISVLILFLKALRFRILLENSGINISLWQVFKVFIASQVTTQLPGGEAGRGLVLKKESGTAMSRSAGAVASQAMIEFMAAATVAILGSFFYREFIGASLAGTVILVLWITAVLNKNLIPAIIKYLARFKIVKKYYKKILKAHLLFRQNVFGKEGFIPQKGFTTAFLLGLSSHLAGGLLLFLVAYFIGAPLSPGKSLFIYCASIIITSVAGFSPGGLGFTEGAITGLLLAEKIPLTQTVAIVLIFRAVTLVFNVIIGIIFLIIFYSRVGFFVRKLQKNFL